MSENQPTSLKLSPYVPYDPFAEIYVKKEGHQALPPSVGSVQPFEYSGWIDESYSWHDTCYIHAGLNPTTTCLVYGPDALKLFESICVNSFKKFPVGTGKHAIVCNEKGHVIVHGLLLRLGEEEFQITGLYPYLEYAIKKSGLNVEFRSIMEELFVFQLGGPKTLEVIEAAAKEDLHDIRFIHFRRSRIAGREVNIVRMGMCGTLAYEVQGNVKDAIPVYEEIMKAGKAFGIRKLGRHSYRNVHTEGGFPNMNLHFPNGKDEEYEKFLADKGIRPAGTMSLSGSLGTDVNKRYLTPVEMGWSRMINFDHDFPGKKVLEKEKADPKRLMVTLVWNVDDIMDVKRSQYMPGESYEPMDDAEDYSYSVGGYDLHAEMVLKYGKEVGLSTGRAFSPHYKEMLSLGVIDAELCRIGTEVTVLWGRPGSRQKEIRAVVNRYPYINENRNENVDVETIPHPDFK